MFVCIVIEWGRIININSCHGLVGTAGKCGYSAAKHGLMGLTKVNNDACVYWCCCFSFCCCCNWNMFWLIFVLSMNIKFDLIIKHFFSDFRGYLFFAQVTVCLILKKFQCPWNLQLKDFLYRRVCNSFLLNFIFFWNKD